MVSFQKATQENIELIRELAQKSWNSAYSNILSMEQIKYMLREMYSSETISEQIANENFHYYLIANDHVNVGFMGFEFDYENRTTKLHRIYLLEEAKGKSLGKKALHFLTEEVSRYANHRIILNVNKENGAKNFYESQGYKVYGEGIFDIGEGYVMDDYLMEYTL